MNANLSPHEGRGLVGRVARDAALYGAAHILSRGTYLVLVPILTRVLAPEDLGSVDLLMAAMALAASLISLEINQGLARYVPATRDPRAQKQLASTALWYSLIVFSAFALLVMATAEQVAVIVLGSRQHADAVRAAAIASWTGAVFLVIHGQLRWELRPKAYAITGLAFSATSMIAIAGLVAGAHAGAAGVFAGQAIGSATGIAVALGFARHSFGFQLEASALARLLAFSAPLVPATFAAFLAANADRFAISRLMGNSDVALYGVGYRVASVVGLAVTGFQLALTPLIYARYEHKSTPAELARVFRVVLGLGVFLWMAVSMFAPEIIAVLATPTYAPSAAVVPYLAGAVMIAGMVTFAPGLAIAGHSALMSVLAIATALVSVALNLALVPLLGIEGAGAAALISSSAGFVFTMTFSQRHYPIPYPWATVGVVVAIAAGAVGLEKLIAADGAGGFLLRGALLLAAAAAFAGMGLLPLSRRNAGMRRDEDV